MNTGACISSNSLVIHRYPIENIEEAGYGEGKRGRGMADRWSENDLGSDTGEYSLLVACLTSQQHASVSQGRICTDNLTCWGIQRGVD